MCEGYHSAGDEEGTYSPLDELLCEYVDGTMDPVVREAFEEYLCAHPELRDHIECLRHTRSLLCRYGCSLHAPRGMQSRLRQQLAGEGVWGQPPGFDAVAERLGAAAGFTSAMVVVMLAGMLAGMAALTDPEAAGRAPLPRFDVQAAGFSHAASAVLPQRFWHYHPTPSLSIAHPLEGAAARFEGMAAFAGAALDSLSHTRLRRTGGAP